MLGGWGWVLGDGGCEWWWVIMGTQVDGRGWVGVIVICTGGGDGL